MEIGNRYDYDTEYNAMTLRKSTFYINENYQYEFSRMRSQILKNVSSLNDYVIYYKDAFKYQMYTFLLTNQKTFVGNDLFVSKIVRLCKFDSSFKTYVDMELSCQLDGVKYNLLQESLVAKLNGTDYLIASFAKGHNPENVGSESILCRMSLENLNSDLTQAQMQFINGNQFNVEERYFPINLVSKMVSF